MTCIVELVGPAGTGKSTLEKILVEKNANIYSEIAPSPRVLWDLPFFALNLFQILPTLISQFSEGKGKGKGKGRLSRREIAWLSLVNGWYRKLLKEPGSKDKVIVLNQGPIFLITALYCFGPELLHTPRFSTFWDNAFTQWAKTLNLVVLLDASDDCLYQRINERDEIHIMKSKEPERVSKFMNDWRLGYLTIIKILNTYSSGLDIYPVNTEDEVPAETANQIVNKISLQCRNHG